MGARGDRYEQPLSRAEAEALLDDPRAELVYGEKTIAIIAPSSLRRQRQEHVDLLAAFLTDERLTAGANFLRNHTAALAAAEARHGVAREAIVSILMWETRLGTITGEWLAFNSFISQAFFADEAHALALAREGLAAPTAAQQRRVETIRARGRANLLALARHAKARGIDPLAVKGSWAGAIGYPQFMPASLRWAEDGDGDGRIDLYHFPDAIASVARYLGDHGFRRNREKAVWSYNHEAGYVKGVLAWADELRARTSGSAALSP